jgi:cytochrome c biogenesis protein CcmG, thiol:disulfide interchange protein DsbE
LLSAGWRSAALGLIVSFSLVAARAESPPAVDLDALRGRVVYLDFWASWCVPCRQSFPWMEQMRQAHQSQGLTIIAVNVDQDHADAERFLKQFRPGFEVRYDPEGKLAQRFKVTGMPTSVIIDRAGQVRFTHIGFWPSQGAQADQEISQLLAQAPGGDQ